MDSASNQITALAGTFFGLADAQPDAVLLRSPGREMTRRDLAELARAVGDRLRQGELGPGSLVGLRAPNGPAFLAGLVALWARAAVPILLDNDVPRGQARQIVQLLGGQALFEWDADWPNHATDFLMTSLDAATAPASLGDTAVVKMSSGSTGLPRGILVSAGAVRADTAALESVMGITDADRVLAAIPMSFSYGFGSLTVPALLHGRELVIPERGNPLAPMSAARQCGATVFPSVPVMLDALLKRSTDWRLPPSLRLVMSAGAPLHEATARAFRARLGQPIHVFYGASECGGITYDSAGDAGEDGSVGCVIPGVGVTIDAVSGLVEVRSPAVANGYLPADPAILDGGVFRTSDLGRLDRGRLRLVGRRGELINIGGHKVNPREVEQVIADLPGVDEVIVTSIPGVAGKPHTCCALIGCGDASLSRRQVHDWCLQRLPTFKRPRRIVVVPSIPRGNRGKVDAETVRRLVAVDERQSSA